MILLLIVGLLILRVKLLLLLLFLFLLLLSLYASVIKGIDPCICPTCYASRSCSDSFAFLRSFADVFAGIKLSSIERQTFYSSSMIFFHHGIYTNIVRIVLEISHIFRRYFIIIACHCSAVEIQSGVFGTLTGGFDFFVHIFV